MSAVDIFPSTGRKRRPRQLLVWAGVAVVAVALFIARDAKVAAQNQVAINTQSARVVTPEEYVTARRKAEQHAFGADLCVWCGEHLELQPYREVPIREEMTTGIRHNSFYVHATHGLVTEDSFARLAANYAAGQDYISHDTKASDRLAAGKIHFVGEGEVEALAN